MREKGFMFEQSFFFGTGRQERSSRVCVRLKTAVAPRHRVKAFSEMGEVVIFRPPRGRTRWL